MFSSRWFPGYICWLGCLWLLCCLDKPCNISPGCPKHLPYALVSTSEYEYWTVKTSIQESIEIGINLLKSRGCNHNINNWTVPLWKHYVEYSPDKYIQRFCPIPLEVFLSGEEEINSYSSLRNAYWHEWQCIAFFKDNLTTSFTVISFPFVGKLSTLESNCKCFVISEQKEEEIVKSFYCIILYFPFFIFIILMWLTHFLLILIYCLSDLIQKSLFGHHFRL